MNKQDVLNFIKDENIPNRDKLEIIGELLKETKKTYNEARLEQIGTDYVRLRFYRSGNELDYFTTDITYTDLNRNGIDYIQNNIKVDFDDEVKLVYPLRFEINAVYLIRYFISIGYKMVILNPVYPRAMAPLCTNPVMIVFRKYR